MVNGKCRAPIVITVLMVLSFACNMPLGSNTTKDEDAGQKKIEIVDQSVYTTNVASHAAGYFAHPETAELLELVQSEGYTSIVESGDFSFSDGGKLHAVSFSDGESLVILVQVETAVGAVDSFIAEVIDDHTVLYRDKSGSILVVMDGEGSGHFEIKDAEGKPVSSVSSISSNYRLASIKAQALNGCTTGMGTEFSDCLNKKMDWMVAEDCAMATAVLAGVCLSPPFADCVIAFVPYYAYCWFNVGNCQAAALVDDPPTFEYSGEQFVEPYAYCQENTLFRDDLFQVQVECNDDRQPKPANFMVNLTAGEAKEFSCTDCSGQSSRGIIPPPGEVSSVVCEYGCLEVGEGKDRCLNEGETPTISESFTSDISNRIGNYTSSTGVCAPYIKDWSLTAVKDEITIAIDEKGSVTGSMDVFCEGAFFERTSWSNTDGSSHFCTAKINFGVVGTLSGVLDESGESGRFELASVITKEIIRDDCPSGTEKTPIQYNSSATFEFFDETLVGVVPDFFSFEATKQ